MKKIKKILSVALTGIIFLSSNIPAYAAEQTDKSVYIGGEAFGVKFYANGVMVINLEDYYDGEKYVCPAKSGGLKKSDIIKEVNGYKITANEDLKTLTEQCSGKTLNFTIERNGKEIQKDINPVKNTVGVYLIGAWVRDSCAGIGTVTYYDADNNYFAALGHGICDSDTSALLPLARGEVLFANISGINKSVAGKAGSLNGYFSESTIGNLTKNSNLGIYGTANNNFKYNDQKMDIAESNEIKEGNAKIFTTIDGDKAKYYDIKIKRICNRSKNSNENFIIEITDKELLDKCGGIVQGMSGSPIVQNNKLVGAITHVFVNNPKEGYGVFLQNMVDCYNN